MIKKLVSKNLLSPKNIWTFSHHGLPIKNFEEKNIKDVHWIQPVLINVYKNIILFHQDKKKNKQAFP